LTAFWTPQQLADIGVVTQQAADDFVNANTEYQLEMRYTITANKWLLVGDDVTSQTFWSTTTTEYRFAQEWEQEQLVGLENS
ncbi:hypothetical protein AADZ86_19315, partial [Colwelliaceae bacterium BS250]